MALYRLDQLCSGRLPAEEERGVLLAEVLQTAVRADGGADGPLAGIQFRARGLPANAAEQKLEAAFVQGGAPQVHPGVLRQEFKRGVGPRQ